MVNIEVCANSVQSAVAAQKGGAVRVELCSNLPDGGTTPSKSQIELTRKYIDIALHTIIRPRGGDFLYDDIDFETMKEDIDLCGQLKCDGVVIGILDKEGGVDMVRNRELISIARKYGMSVTFHRAFDRVKDVNLALEHVIDLGCDRILTSGGYPTALEGKEILRNLVDRATNRIIIMGGAGVRESNVEELVKYTGLNEVHGTFQTLHEGGMIFRNPNFSNTEEYSYPLSNMAVIQNVVRNANT